MHSHVAYTALCCETHEHSKHTSEALAVPLLTKSETGAVFSIDVPVASYESLIPWLSAMRTMSPLSISMRATSTPDGNKPPPLLLTSTTYLQH